MAVYQETGMPAVSLPNGANNLPVQFLPYFERFERIYLWMDADEVGRASAEKFAKVINIHHLSHILYRNWVPTEL